MHMRVRISMRGTTERAGGTHRRRRGGAIPIARGPALRRARMALPPKRTVKRRRRRPANRRRCANATREAKRQADVTRARRGEIVVRPGFARAGAPPPPGGPGGTPGRGGGVAGGAAGGGGGGGGGGAGP